MIIFVMKNSPKSLKTLQLEIQIFAIIQLIIKKSISTQWLRKKNSYDENTLGISFRTSNTFKINIIIAPFQYGFIKKNSCEKYLKVIFSRSNFSWHEVFLYSKKWYQIFLHFNSILIKTRNHSEKISGKDKDLSNVQVKHMACR